MSSKIHAVSNKPSQPLDWSRILERGPDESLRWTFDGQENFFAWASCANRHAVGPSQIALPVVLAFSLASPHTRKLYSISTGMAMVVPVDHWGSAAGPTRGQTANA